MTLHWRAQRLATRRHAPGRLGAFRRRGQRGTALVELALLLPFLLWIVFGTIDLGRALTTWNQAKSAARAAADYAAAAPYRQQNAGLCADPNNATFRGRSEAGNTFTFTYSPALPCTTGALSQAQKDAAPEITVTAARPFALYTPLLQGLLGPFTVRASVTARVAR